MHQALSKGSTSLHFIKPFAIAGDETIVDKSWTREFTRQIIAVERQGICRTEK
jgi:hypothetical protein